MQNFGIEIDGMVLKLIWIDYSNAEFVQTVRRVKIN